MERTLFDKSGRPIAYIASDYHSLIYLWEGAAVAYVFQNEHVYGLSGRHLGWFVEDILYDDAGKRVGFTSLTCPVSVAAEPSKAKKQPRDEIRPRWEAPPFPHLSPDFARKGLADFLKEGKSLAHSEKPSPKKVGDDKLDGQ